MSTLLDVQDLHVHFTTSKGRLHAVRGVNFSIQPKEIVGIVGESGCGKSAALKALTQLHPHHTTQITGKLLYQGSNLLDYPQAQMRKVRGKEMSMIFQDPMTSLNPTMKIGKQIKEGYLVHFPKNSRKKAYAQVIHLLAKVGIPNPEALFDAYPHTLSGGMRQRVMIAIALACKPKILLADEPTTALDVTIQAQILKLLKEIQQEMDMSILLITHDLSVVTQFCDRTLVMYAGKIIESASTEDLFNSPQHPYTKRLIAAIPDLTQKKDQPLATIKGAPPNLMYPIQGCSFCPRCPEAMEICVREDPPFFEPHEQHLSACFRQDPRCKSRYKL